MMILETGTFVSACTCTTAKDYFDDDYKNYNNYYDKNYAKRKRNPDL